MSDWGAFYNPYSSPGLMAPPPPPPPPPPPADFYAPAGWAATTPTSAGGTYAPAPAAAPTPVYSTPTQIPVSQYGQNVFSQIAGGLTQDPAKYAAIGAAYGRAVGPSMPAGTYSPGSGLSSFSGTPLDGGGGGSVFDTGTSPVPYPNAGGLTPSPISPAIPSPLPPPPPPLPPSVFDTGTNGVPYPNSPTSFGGTPTGMASGTVGGRDAIASLLAMKGGLVGPAASGGAAYTPPPPPPSGGGSYTFDDPMAPGSYPQPSQNFEDMYAPAAGLPASFADRFNATNRSTPYGLPPDFLQPTGPQIPYVTSPPPEPGPTVTPSSPPSHGSSEAPPYTPPVPPPPIFPSYMPPALDPSQPHSSYGLSQMKDALSIMRGAQGGDTLSPSDLAIPFGGGAPVMNQGGDGDYYPPFNDPTYFGNAVSPPSGYGNFQNPLTEVSAPPVVGTASTYDPTQPGWQTGGMGLASGGTYNPNAFSAAIQTSLRNKFGGVPYGQAPSSGLVEGPGGMQAVVDVNDVGPLVQNRVMDLSTAAMKYFNPSSSPNSGTVPNMQITPLPSYYPPGPVGPVGPTGPNLPTPGLPLPNMLGPTLPYTPTTGYVKR